MAFDYYRAWLTDTKHKEKRQMIYMKDFDDPLEFWRRFYSWEGNIKVLMPQIYIYDTSLYERDIVEYNGHLYLIIYSVSVGAFVAEYLRDTFMIYLLPDIIQKAKVVGNLYEDYDKIKEILNEQRKKK